MNFVWIVKLIVLVLTSLQSYAIQDTTDTVKKAPVQIEHQKGVASYYADKFEGRKTATGEILTKI